MLEPEDVLAARVQDEEGVARVAEGAPISTDRHNLLQTRSPRILDKALGPAGTERVFAPYDPLRREAAGPGGARLVRRFIRDGRLPRARRMAGAMAPGTPRRVAQALIDVASGGRARGEAELLSILREDPGALDALRALMVLRGEALTRGEDPDGLLTRAASDPGAAAVIEGWRRSRAGRLAEVRDLETDLAAVVRHGSLHEAALRLRIGWRLASGDRDRAREAITLLDTFMADYGTAPHALLRARLALAAGEAPTAYASLLEIADLGLYVSDDQQTAREGLALLEQVQAASGLAAPDGLRERLIRASAGRPLP